MNDATSNTASSDAESPRSIADIRRDGNHLKDEPSLYLQQHAHNPIDWYPWSEAALRRARAEDKPIFLSIGYSSCHWCHVMEHEVFEKDDVAEYMNEHFVCIKVDREERPDLDAVYMDAVQMITGGGGWPMSVFLTPELRPFFGGTYIPHAKFLELCRQISQVFATRREALEQQAAEITARITGQNLTTTPGGKLTAEIIDKAVTSGKQSFDETHAGFSQQQKFPTPVRWQFLLHRFRKTGDEELARMIVATCEAMAGGGIYDHVGGGFHRYTVDPAWTVPHFEKMLYDNAQLAGLYLEAGVVFGRKDFTALGLDVLDFLLREMQDERGGFYSSFDADSGGHEGTYYIWSRDEISAVVGDEDGPVLADLLGVDARGNFERSGKSVLTRRADREQIAREHEREPESLDVLFERHRENLRRQRDQRTPPGLDRKIITSWNGLTIAALAQAHAVTGRPEYLDGARRAADLLLREHRDDTGRLRRASSDGRAAGLGILDDYAFLADGLLELYQVCGEARYLEAAGGLLETVRTDFVHPSGGYFLTAEGDEAPLARHVEYFDSVIPSGNAAVLGGLIRYGAITGRTEFHDEARRCLDAWSGLLERAGLEMAGWFDAAGKVIGPYHDVVIAGDRDDPLTAELRAIAVATLPASAVVSQVPATGPDARLAEIAPALIGKTSRRGRPVAYVCDFGVCQAPTSDPVQLREQLLAGWQR